MYYVLFIKNNQTLYSVELLFENLNLDQIHHPFSQKKKLKMLIMLTMLNIVTYHFTIPNPIPFTLLFFLPILNKKTFNARKIMLLPRTLSMCAMRSLVLEM